MKFWLSRTETATLLEEGSVESEEWTVSISEGSLIVESKPHWVQLDVKEQSLCNHQRQTEGTLRKETGFYWTYKEGEVRLPLRGRDVSAVKAKVMEVRRALDL